MRQEKEPPQIGLADRTFLLSRYKNGVEETVGDDKDEVMDIVMHYRHLVSQRIKTKANSLPMSHFAGQIGSILFHFFPEFPDTELPMAGGITEFKFQGYEFRFDTEGARAVETINVADHLHNLGICKPYFCIEPTCHNYSVAVDDRTVLPPEHTFFMRHAPCTENTSRPFNNDGHLSQASYDSLFHGSFDNHTNDRLRISPDEFIISRRDHKTFVDTNGIVLDEEQHAWEIMPAPTDASQLDMHLAQLSSIDTRYVLLFTSDVKHYFDKDLQRSYEENDDLSEESEGEDAYVESALVPGLQQRDFNRVIDTNLALSGLKLDPATKQRMESILAS